MGAEAMAAAEPVNVAAFLPRQAGRNPGGWALRTPAGRTSGGDLRYQSYTFRELDGWTDAAARWLEAAGIGRGTRTLLLVRPGFELVTLCFAFFKVGAVPVVIDPGMGLKAFLECVRRTRPEAVAGKPEALAVAGLFPGSFAGVRTRVGVPGGRRFLGSLERYGGGGYGMRDFGAGETAAILFTSGSTGPAKGVVYTHGMMAAQVRAIRACYGLEPGEVDLPMLPVFALFNPALGLTTVVPEMNPSRPAAVDPERIVRAIRQNGVTNSFGSPALWRKIVGWCEARGERLPTLRRVLVAGAPVPAGLVERLRAILPGGEVHTPYGATEGLPVCSISGREILGGIRSRAEAGAGTCVGRPLPGMEVAIRPVQEGPVEVWRPEEALGVGEVGEICVRGAVVSPGYDRLPEATARAKIPDPAGGPGAFWHRMGDLGYRDEEGRVWFCGRQAERVRAADGRVHYPDCVEAILNQHPGVARTALIGSGTPGQEEPAIAVEPEPGSWPRTGRERNALAGAILARARANPVSAAVARVHFVRHFPVDVRHNAKIHRLVLRRKLAGRPGEGGKEQG